MAENMKKYTVEIYESYRKTIEVEAESEEDAVNMASDGEGVEVFRKTINFEADIY